MSFTRFTDEDQAAADQAARTPTFADINEVTRLQAEVDRLNKALAKMQIDLDNRDVDLAAKRREIAPLKSRITQLERERNPPAELREVFEHWRAQIAPGADKFGEGRQKVIRKRLREGHTIDELKEAIDGCRLSSWHMENKVNALTYILRDEDTIRKFRIIAWRAQKGQAA